MLDYKHHDIALDAGILCSTSTLESRIEEDFEWYLDDEDEDSPLHNVSVDQFTEYVMGKIDPNAFCNMLADAIYESRAWDEVMDMRDDAISDLVMGYMTEMRDER